jgi:tRNA(Ile)-lysidine synthase
MELICQGDKLFWREPLPSSAAEWDWTKESVFTFGNWCFEAVPTDHTGVSSKFEAVFDGETLGNLLIAAPPLPGEQMLAFGRQEPVKVKKLRVDGKIPAYYALPVIKNSRGHIVWYPGVKHSAAAPVTEATEKMIRLRAFSPKFRIGVGID